MNILVTGGAGFIGSNFVLYMLEKHENIRIVTLDKLTYAGNLTNLQEVMNHPSHTFIQGDICNRALVDNIFKEHRIEGVIHFAAESHVDNSIKNPIAFIETNVLGTITLLEVARKYWMDEIGGGHKKEYSYARFHHISTDEVYGSLGVEGYFTENTPYAPNSPYSASKASSDMIVRSYFHTFGMNVVTTNCSNNYGPMQHEEKFIPTIIKKALALEPIPIYGNGKNIRDWLYVLDHCRAIENVFFNGKSGETYVIGGHCEMKNIEVAKSICDILDIHKPIPENKEGVTSYRQLITFVKDRPGHDFRYSIDDTKIRDELVFQNLYKFAQGMEKTILYYLKNKYESMRGW